MVRTGMASAVVIAERMTRMNDAAEMTRMAAEKQTAAMESALAVQRAWLRACFTPLSVSSNWLSVANAALGPYRRRSTANARRLAKKRR
jgi:hypothetical protein